MLILLPLTANASVMHLVDSMDNLFFTDWGHPYNVLPYDDSNNQFGAISTFFHPLTAGLAFP